MKLPITTLLTLADANLKDSDSGTTAITPNKGLVAFMDGGVKNLVGASLSTSGVSGAGEIVLGDVLIQFGQVAQSGDFTLTFPKAFDGPPAYISVNATTNDTSNVSAVIYRFESNPTATSADVKLFNNTASEFVYWLAIGNKVQ